jgi:hypothetical protein
MSNDDDDIIFNPHFTPLESPDLTPFRASMFKRLGVSQSNLGSVVRNASCYNDLGWVYQTILDFFTKNRYV